MPVENAAGGGGANRAGRRPAAGLAYAVVTPVRDEAENLERLAGALADQTVPPRTWVIVDTGSRDSTPVVAERLAHTHDWVEFTRLATGGETMRGGPIVRAFHCGLELLGSPCDVVVKQDADTSMGPDYFQRVLEAFCVDSRLGIAGGVGYENDGHGLWRQRHGTGPGVWGASRAYRRACLDEILPLEERMGWDSLDAIAAAVRGWSTRVVEGAPFLHHRPEGARDRTRFAFWSIQGEAAHYMGYRPLYLGLRTGYRMLKEPAAVGVAWGYVASVLRRDARCPDAAVRAYVREQQKLTRLARRAREALRPRAALRGSGDSY